MKCNSSKGLLKRFIPFFLTFAVGLFIASFFVTVAAPKFQWGQGRRHQHKQEDIRRDERIKQLEERLAQRELEIRNLRDRSVDWNGYDAFDVPAPPLPPLPVSEDAGSAPPKAPAAPKRVK